MCNHELKRLFYTKDADYDIQTCRVDSENEKDKYTLCYCEKCGQVFVMEIAKTYTELDKEPTVNEAWDFVKALYGLSDEELYEIFPNGCPYEMTYSEAKAKYEKWKKFKEEIHVGDEIRIKTSYSADAVVIGMDDYDLFIVWKDGETDRIEPPEREQWVKTGRHFKEVEELLKKITEESNED